MDIADGTKPVVVGAGGPAVYGEIRSGSDSSIGQTVVAKGGGGGSNGNIPAASGGSGGGGGGDGSPSERDARWGDAVSGQGYRGGYGADDGGGGLGCAESQCQFAGWLELQLQLSS